MTSARDELSAVNELLGEATAARNAAQQAYDRLEKPAALLDEAVEALAVEESVYKAELVAWYSNGCIGLRPAVPPSLEAAERRVGELGRDKRAPPSMNISRFVHARVSVSCNKSLALSAFFVNTRA